VDELIFSKRSPMKIDEIREKGAEIMTEYAMHEVRAVTDPERKIKLPNVYDYLDRFLAIKVGGEVAQDCPYCGGLSTRSTEVNNSGQTILFCQQCKTSEYSRLRTVRDVLEKELEGR
jgi:hypothetical protein